MKVQKEKIIIIINKHLMYLSATGDAESVTGVGFRDSQTRVSQGQVA